MSPVEWRLIGLQVFTGLVVTFVRHDLRQPRVAWDSLVNFLSAWFVHTMAVVLLMVIAAVSIQSTHKFFLGYEREQFKDKFEELSYYIVVTVLIAIVGIWFVARFPTDE